LVVNETKLDSQKKKEGKKSPPVLTNKAQDSLKTMSFATKKQKISL
jgi:hypothetical protein